jgi:hypothetical protein
MHFPSRYSGPPAGGLRHRGHAHFWERALSRGQFIRTAAATTGLAASSGLWMPGLAQAAPSDPTPRPIPGGIQVSPDGPLYHVAGGLNPDGSLAEPSSITDFNGVVAIAFVSGTGTGTDTTTGATTPLLIDSDMRFMSGEYVALDGHHYQGTFGFV